MTSHSIPHSGSGCGIRTYGVWKNPRKLSHNSRIRCALPGMRNRPSVEHRAIQKMTNWLVSSIDLKDFYWFYIITERPINTLMQTERHCRPNALENGLDIFYPQPFVFYDSEQQRIFISRPSYFMFTVGLFHKDKLYQQWVCLRNKLDQSSFEASSNASEWIRYCSIQFSRSRKLFAHRFQQHERWEL